jgi:hypothetical protein
LSATCVSFLRVIPGSRLYTPASDLRLWDLSAAASLCRNLIEAYYVLLYINSDPADEADREFQEALWEYHAAFECHEMLSVALPNSTKLPGAAALLGKRRQQLEQCLVFQRQSLPHRKMLLAGKKFKLPDNIELSKAAGISEIYFRSQYKYCCTFAHSSPFSISQLDSFRAGTPEAERLLGMLVDLATGYTAIAIRDYSRRFPDQRDLLPANVRECIQIWEETFKWENNPWFNAPDEN